MLRFSSFSVDIHCGPFQDQFDSINLLDNEIVNLENFPYLKRLTTLLINNNRISRINPNVGGDLFFMSYHYNFHCIYISSLVLSTTLNLSLPNFLNQFTLMLCAEFLPKLQKLVLTNNRLVNLVDLDPLAALVNLQTLILLDNIVTKKPNYCLYVINKLNKLRLLDFRKVKKKVS